MDRIQVGFVVTTIYTLKNTNGIVPLYNNFRSTSNMYVE